MLRGPQKSSHSPGSKLFRWFFPIEKHTWEEQMQSGGGEVEEWRRWVNLCRLISDSSSALFISWSRIHGKRYSQCSSKYPNVRHMREFSLLRHHSHFWTLYHPYALGDSAPKVNKFWWGLVEIFCGRQTGLEKWTFGKKNPHFGTGPQQSNEHNTFKMSAISISCHWQEGNTIFEGEPWHPNPSLKSVSSWKHLDVFYATEPCTQERTWVCIYLHQIRTHSSSQQGLQTSSLSTRCSDLLSLSRMLSVPSSCHFSICFPPIHLPVSFPSCFQSPCTSQKTLNASTSASMPLLVGSIEAFKRCYHSSTWDIRWSGGRK